MIKNIVKLQDFKKKILKSNFNISRFALTNAKIAKIKSQSPILNPLKVTKINKITKLNYLFFIFLGLTFLACKNSSSENKKVLSSVSKTKSVSENKLNFSKIDDNFNKQKVKIVIKNKSDYSNKFIQELGLLAY